MGTMRGVWIEKLWSLPIWRETPGVLAHNYQRCELLDGERALPGKGYIQVREG